MNDCSRFALLLALHAITEQPTFIALLQHRFLAASRGYTFIFAAILASAIKTFVFYYSTDTYLRVLSLQGHMEENNNGHVSKWLSVWRVLFPILNVLLYITQIFSSYILFILGVRGLRELDSRKSAEQFSRKKPIARLKSIYMQTAHDSLALEDVHVSELCREGQHLYQKMKTKVTSQVKVPVTHY